MKKELKNRIVYRHRNPITNEVFYVGSGTSSRSKSSRRKSDAWRDIVSRCGYIIEIVARDLTEDDSIDLEYLIINTYGTLIDGDGTLVNIKRDRYKHHWSTKKKLETTLEKMSKLNVGNKYTLGRKLTQEHKDKIGIYNLGRKHTKESIEKMKRIHKGKKFSKEHLENMSKCRLGKKLPQSTRDKMSLSRRRGMISDENYKLLLEDFSNIDKIVHGKTFKDLSLKYNLSAVYLSRRFKKYKKINKYENL